MSRLSHALNRLEANLLYVALAGLAFGALYIVLAVGLSWAGGGVPDELLLVAEAMILIIFLPQGYVTAQALHLNVTVIADRLPGWIQVPLDVFARLIGLVFYGILAWGGWGALDYVLQNDSYFMGDLAVPEWITRAVFLIGIVAALLRQALGLISPGGQREKP